MNRLYSFRSSCLEIYKKWDIYILPVCRFVVAFFSLILLNLNIGYMDILNKVYVVLIVAALCSIMPMAGTVAAGIIFIILHCFALDLFVGLFAAALYMIIFIFAMRFITQDSLALVLGPTAIMAGIPAIIPVALGLVHGVACVITGICTVFSWCFLDSLPVIARYIESEDPSGIEILQKLIDELIYHQDLIALCICFTLTILVVYLIRTLVNKYGFLIAAASGCVVFLVARLITGGLFRVSLDLPKEILGMFLSLLIAVVLTFFLFSLDYKKTRLLQFEDDDYFYFVKAVPKIIAEKKGNDFLDDEDEEDEDYDADETWMQENSAAQDTRYYEPPVNNITYDDEDTSDYEEL